VCSPHLNPQHYYCIIWTMTADQATMSKKSGLKSTEKRSAWLTKSEKLIILRNALFDDDEGGFGAERDVSRWLAPA